MKVINDISALSDAQAGLSWAIGNFDGFHPGHQALLAAASAHGPFGILTFEPHPRALFVPDHPPFRIMSANDKYKAAQAAGAAAYIQLPFTHELAGMLANEFHDQILAPLKPKALIVGEDFRYGKSRLGDQKTLQAAAVKQGWTINCLDLVSDEEGVYGSTRARQAVRDGDFPLASDILDGPWTISGVVERGDQIGRTIGFPTANIAMKDYLRPPIGIFAVRVGIEDEPIERAGAAYFGYRPAVDGTDERFEVHLLDFDGDLYDKTICIAMVEQIRGDMDLPGLDALKAQIAIDCDAARRILSVV